MINRWVVPDIHGCLKTLKTLLETRINLTRLDLVYFLGDYIDRGPDSKGIIDYIMSLERNGYNVHCLKGNHEDICVKSWKADRKRFAFRYLLNILRFLGLHISRSSSIEKNWRANGGNSTLDSFGVKCPRDIGKEYIDWMNNTVEYIELDDFILVHAGLNFNIKNPLDDVSSMLGIRHFKVDRDKIRNKRVIHGHTPVDIDCIKKTVQSDVYDSLSIDNGVISTRVGLGNLVAYNIDTKELVIQPKID